MHRHGGTGRPAERLALTLAIASVFFAAPARAQQPTADIGDNAALVPRGTVRLGVRADFLYADQLAAGTQDRAPLASRFGFVAADNVAVSAAVSITRLPLTLEYGVLRRLTLGVSAPLVRRRVEISADTGIRAAGAPPSVTRVTDLSAFANLNHSNVGDIDFSARIGILDGFASSAPLRARLAVEGIFRLAAGPSRNASVLTDPGAGDGQNDIEGRVLADLALGRRWSISARATRTVQRPDRQLIVSADSVFPSRRIAMGVERDLGDITAIDVIPRVTITRFLSLAGVVSQRSKGADTYDGAVPAPAWGLVAEPTGSSSTTRVGIGVVFATGPGAIGRAPLELSFQHSQLVRTSGSTVPDFRADQIGGRVYIRLF